MPRMVRCGLIQAKNELTPEHSLGALKKAMVGADPGLIQEIRNTRQLFRDRRPETFVRLVELAL